MPTAFNPALVTVFLPVGGRATRALEVTADVIPKHLIELGNGLPVLEVALRQLQEVGFRRFVFCTGHHQEQITNFVHKETWRSFDSWYELSVESQPLGPEGAILAAIDQLGIAGQAMFVAGDVMVPWAGLVSMNERHAANGAVVTAGLTSFITPRTTDVGKFIVDPTTYRVKRLYGRTEEASAREDELALTSAGLSVVTIKSYVGLCRDYVSSRTGKETRPFGLRDDVMPWALKNEQPGLYGHDLQGEVLDLGTPSNIHYGRENWRDYVLGQ